MSFRKYYYYLLKAKCLLRYRGHADLKCMCILICFYLLQTFLMTSEPKNLMICFTLIDILIRAKPESICHYLQTGPTNLVRLVAKLLQSCCMYSNHLIETFNIKINIFFIAEIMLKQFYSESVHRLTVLFVITAKSSTKLASIIEQILIEGLLTDNFICGLFALDLWCLWIR